MMDLAQRKAGLEGRLAALHARMRGIEDALDTTPSADWEDLALEREDDEVLEGVGLSGQAEIRQIRAALDRIDAGTYGACARCGGPIEQQRLNAVPEAPLCRTCAT